MPKSIKINQNYKYVRGAALGSLALMLVGGAAMLQPFSFSENTNATTERTASGDYYIETTTTDLNLSINTTPAGAQETASHDVIVKTDDPAGFTLTVSVNNDTSNALNLNGSTSATEKFAATSGTYTSPAALDDNAWGFADTLTKKNNDQWAAVPLLKNAQQIKQTSSATPSGETTTIHYGIKAKYDGKHSNGNYSNVITYSVVGNTPPVTIEYMQDKTYANWCADLETTTNVSDVHTYELYDRRTEEPYYIRKFADGNCWMVENLYLRGGMTLTSMDSNVTSNYTLPASSTSFSGSPTWQAYMYEGGATVDSARYRYGAVYDGSYFSFRAARANAGNINSSGAEVSSVCPKNWRLFDRAEGRSLVGVTEVAADRRLLYSDRNGGIANQIRPGYYGGSGLAENGTRACWYSMQVNTGYTAVIGELLENDSGLTTGGDGYKNYGGWWGESVRCILSANDSPVTYKSEGGGIIL